MLKMFNDSYSYNSYPTLPLMTESDRTSRNHAGGNGDLGKAWVFFKLDDATRQRIYGRATDVLSGTDIPQRSKDHLHISLLTVHASPDFLGKYRQKFSSLVTDFLTNRKRVFLRKRRYTLLPAGDPKYIAMELKEVDNKISWLSILREHIRQSILESLIEEYGGDITIRKTDPDPRAKKDQISPIANFPAERYFVRSASASASASASEESEVLVLRRDEYDDNFHVSINTEYDFNANADTKRQVEGKLRIDPGPPYDVELNSDRFEFKIKDARAVARATPRLPRVSASASAERPTPQTWDFFMLDTRMGSDHQAPLVNDEEIIKNLLRKYKYEKIIDNYEIKQYTSRTRQPVYGANFSGNLPSKWRFETPDGLNSKRTKTDRSKDRGGKQVEVTFRIAKSTPRS